MNSLRTEVITFKDIPNEFIIRQEQEAVAKVLMLVLVRGRKYPIVSGKTMAQSLRNESINDYPSICIAYVHFIEKTDLDSLAAIQTSSNVQPCL